ncbi:MAG TPA: hypothetical protein VKZ18_12350 [Polyangia bacterium]|nr:hypothetical protein [Polyangia bacterium]
MGNLPPEQVQAYLIRELTALIQLHGAAPFVSAPLLEPRPEHFPDPWRADELGVERLALRLLDYAGLAELGVEVEIFTGEVDVKKVAPDGTASSWSHKGAAAWFAGIHEGRCVFGASATKLKSPDVLAGVMAHEIAHAFRHRHGLNLRKREVEEPLTDLTTIYLGFGILTTNASYRYRAGGGMQGAYTRTQWSHESLGYLPPEAMSFLLACQVVARDLPAAESRRIAGLLETNQAAYFRAACKALDRDELRQRLKLPPPGTWPVVAAPHPQPFDTSGDPPAPEPGAVEIAANRGRNAGLPVFRVGHTKQAATTLLSLALAIPAAIAGAWLSPWAAVGAFLVTSIAVHKFGGGERYDRCSEPDCNQIIPADAAHCPGCGGTVSGRIDNANERLAAREALEEQDEPDEAEPDVG